MYKATQRLKTLFLACFTVIISVFLAVALWVTPTNSYTASAADTPVATFALGANGSASHNDGTSKSSYSETNNGYTLSIVSGTNMYTGARDAKGNSCIKFGASSKAGSCSFTVPSDITSVIIYVAKYKSNTTKISINSASTQTLTKNSNDGAYDAITVDTASTKTISFTTVSGGYRAMLNTIEFYKEATSSCEHANTTTTTVNATCTTEGSTTVTCDDCGEEISKETSPATGHLNTTEIETQAPSCTVAGSKSVTCGDCSTSWNEEIPATGHNYVDGVCEKCGASEPLEKEETLEIVANKGKLSSDSGEISWSGENISLINKKGSTAIRTSDSNEYRAYSGSKTTISTVNGENLLKIVISCTSNDYAEVCKTSISNAGYTTTVNGTNVTITGLSTPSITFTASAQWRLNKVTVTYEQDASVAECTHNYEAEVTAPTCTEDGFTTHTCSLCGDSYTDTPTNKTGHNDELTNSVAPNCTTPGTNTYTCSTCSIETTETIPLLGHDYVNGTCKNCEGKMPTKAILTFDDKAKRTEFSSEIQVWKENGIVLTNNKAESTTAVADYAAPARFYKSSEIVISFPDMLKIEFACNSTAYAKDLADSIDSATQNDKIVTVLFMEMTNAFTVTLGAAVRIDSITVHTAKIDSASITLGSDITMNYYVTMPQAAELYLTVNGETVDVEGELQQDGRYKFSLPIPPQFMAENICAELKLGDLVIASMAEYSVKTYAQNKLNEPASSDKLKQLIIDLLFYGDAAYNYVNGTSGQTPVTDGVLTASEATPEETDFTLTKNTEISSYPAYFTGASVYFDSVNKLCIKINTTENVTLTIEYEGVVEDVAVTGTVVYVEDITPLKFDETYTFVLYCDGIVMQTLTYSVNAYAYAMQNDATMGTLALALYRYGMSAEAYNA